MNFLNLKIFALMVSFISFLESNDGVTPIPLEYPTFDWNFEDSKKQIVASIIATGFNSGSELRDAKFDLNKKLMSSNNYSFAGGLRKAIH